MEDHSLVTSSDCTAAADPTVPSGAQQLTAAQGLSSPVWGRRGGVLLEGTTHIGSTARGQPCWVSQKAKNYKMLPQGKKALRGSGGHRVALNGCQTQGRLSAFHPARPVSSASSLSPSREIHPFREGHSRWFPELLVSSPEPAQCSFCRCWKCPCRDGRCLRDRSPFCSVLACQSVTCAPLLPAVAVTVRTLHPP